MTAEGRRKGLTRNFSPSARTSRDRGIVNPMLVLAHRGANRLEPENTVAAMARAMALGADGVELDVHRTADDNGTDRRDAERLHSAVGYPAAGRPAVHEAVTATGRIPPAGAIRSPARSARPATECRPAAAGRSPGRPTSSAESAP